MTKTITIRECHVLIAIWVIVSVLAILPINYFYGTIFLSYDDKGCRLSFNEREGLICPDPQGRTSTDGFVLATYKKTGALVENNKGMWDEKSVLVIAIMSFLPLTFIQFIAFVCLNQHFHWVKIELKSCWSSNDTKKVN